MTEQGAGTHSYLYKVVLLVSSLVTLGYLLAAAAWENHYIDWRRHQREYRQILFEEADDENSRGVARRFRPELQQIVLASLGRVDRCPTCHLGEDNPRMVDRPQPYRYHSGRFLDVHPISRFGCTICHRGQGRAIISQEAKYEEFWSSWLLPLEYTQASCGVCHDPLALEGDGAPRLAHGYRLYKARGCGSCHRIGERGGSFGPVLDNVGAKDKHFFPMAHVRGQHTVITWLYEHFLDPQAVVPGSRMKKTPLTEEEARDLTIYMVSLQDVNLPKEYLPSDKYKQLYESHRPPLADGEALYKEYCHGCHEDAVAGELDVILGKELPAIRNPHYLSRVSDQALALMIRRGRPGTDMPAWHEESGGLRDDEIDAIVGYIARSRRTVSADTFVLLSPQDAEAGRVLFAENCLDCHGERGRGNTAPNLVDPVFRQVYDDRLLGLTIRDGTDNTGMVGFREMRLSDQDISDIIAYLRSLP